MARFNLLIITNNSLYLVTNYLVVYSRRVTGQM